VTHPAQRRPGDGAPPQYGAPAGHPPPGYGPYAPTLGYGPYAAPAGYAPPAGGAPRPTWLAPGGAPLAEFWQRLVASLLDSLILSVTMIIPLLLVFALLFVPYFSSLRPYSPPDPMSLLLLELAGFAIITPLQLIATYIYFVRMVHKTGQTVGKRIMKIRVVRRIDGGPIDLRTARRRWVVQYASAVTAFYFNLADGLWQLWDLPYRQCLHDKCADTVVIQVTL
jgi:uncharacterized RDD family membrane protein YckC